ncbi:MAG: hypothetical protein KJ072_10195 [Verrucomicrobia bacterium]|nr:hypothetical protein [Verrucomicrobiota bacterium]
MTIHNRQQLLAVIAIAAIALLAADRLVLSPLAASWDQRTSRLRDLKQSVTQGTQLLQRRNTIRTRWERMQTQALPSQTSLAEDLLLKAFDRWAKESGASIGSIRPQRKTGDPAFILLECRADASGTLGSLARFLYELENDPLAIKIDLLEMTANDNNGQQLTLTLQVSGLILTPRENL